MTTIWAKMVDTDADGNLEVVQTHDEDPASLWHPDFLSQWRQIPGDQGIGSVLETATQTWYTGSEWLTKKIAESPEPIDPDVVGVAAPLYKGAVTKLRVKSPGANYDVDYIIDTQFDVGNGTHMVAKITFDQYGEYVVSAEITEHGQGYEVGQTFEVKEGLSKNWDKKNPTYAVIEIVEVYDEPGALIPTLPQ